MGIPQTQRIINQMRFVPNQSVYSKTKGHATAFHGRKSKRVDERGTKNRTALQRYRKDTMVETEIFNETGMERTEISLATVHSFFT